MGKLSIVAENLWLDHILKVAVFTPTGDIYLALSTADFTEDGSGAAEPVAMNYSRTDLATPFGEVAGTVARQIKNDALITCPTASGDWGTITHWAIFDHITAGRLLAYGAFDVGKSVTNGQTPKVAIDEIVISVPTHTTYGMTTFCANEMLDMTFLDGNPAYTPTGIWIAMATGNLNDAGSQANECAPSGAYARKQHEGTANWDTAANSVTANKTAIAFTTATGSWGTVSDYFIIDDPDDTEGDMLLYSTWDGPFAVIADDTANIAIGALDITMA